MDLILWRHAEAFEAQGEEADMNRSLTPRGERQAARMAQWLDRQLPEGVRILCSPAKRAEQTVAALGRKYKIRDELSPQSQPDQVLELVQWPLNKNSVLIVGHQPFLGQTVARLLSLPSGECSIRKGGVWWLRARQKDEQQQTVLISVQAAEML
jgi:phosphohistidine phosphatase